MKLWVGAIAAPTHKTEPGRYVIIRWHTCRVSFCRFCALQAPSVQKSSPLLCFLLQQQRQKAGAVFRCLAVEIVRSGRTDIAEGLADPDILGGGVGAVDHQRHHLTGVVRVSDGRVVAVVRLHDEDIVLAQGVADLADPFVRHSTLAVSTMGMLVP